MGLQLRKCIKPGSGAEESASLSGFDGIPVFELSWKVLLHGPLHEPLHGPSHGPWTFALTFAWAFAWTLDLCMSLCDGESAADSERTASLRWRFEEVNGGGGLCSQTVMTV